MNRAIIWPANPKAVDDPREADPELHRTLLHNQPAVYWDSMPIRNRIDGPLNGYIYQHKAVRFRCRVEHVISRKELLEMKEEYDYVPPFRSQCLHSQYPDGRFHPPSETWIKILRIDKIEPLSIEKIVKWDGEPLKAVRGGLVYIRDPIPGE